MVTIKQLDLEKGVVKVGQIQSNLIDGPDTTRLGEIHFQNLIIRIEEYGDILVLVKFKTNWMVRLREHSHIGTQHMFIMHHTYIWNLTVGFEECNEKLIMVNYGHN